MEIIMTEEDLNTIEETLGIQIPELYRKFLSEFPAVLVTERDEGIFHTAERIISQTKAARAYREEDWDIGYTDDLLAIGWNGGGSVYCVKEKESGDTIHLFDHEWGDINPGEAMSLEQFVDEWSEP